MRKPLIFDYQVNRKPSADLPIVYSYDPELCLNVIQVNGIKKPFIEVNTDDVELMTKSKEKHESDDDHFSLLELQTKSFETRERDDERSNNMLELETKTLSNRERDDEHFGDYHLLLELHTKTRERKERDDEHFNHN